MLLDAPEVDHLMGTTGSEVLDEGNAPDDVTDVSPPQCHGVVYLGGEVEYGSTGFTAMRWRVVGHQDATTAVELIATFPTPARADQFVDDQSHAWQRCAFTVITTTDKASDSTLQYRVTAVTEGSHGVTAQIDGVSAATSCQHGAHILQATSNFIIEVSTCGDPDSARAQSITSELENKIDSG